MGIFSFLGKFFTSGSDSASVAKADAVEYKGFLITPAPIKEGGQYRTAGTISREVDGDIKSSQFIRADNTASEQGAIDHSLQKAKQIIDEQGDALLERPHL